MADTISNHLEYFDQDIKQLAASLNQMQQTSKRTFEELDSLTGMWEGMANQAFRNQFQADEENMRNLILFLNKYLEGLRTDHGRYTKCESEIQGMIRAIRI